LVIEVNTLRETGIVLLSKLCKVKELGFSCDALAVVYLKCALGNTGYSSCEKCIQKGKTVDGKMTVPDLNSAK
jgi:hypothetical protein